MKENIDFMLMADDSPADEKGNWHIKILTGEFIECVIKLGEVTPDPTTKTNKFTFEVIKAIDPDNDVTANPRLQKVAGLIATDLIPDTSFKPIKNTINKVKHIFGKSGKLANGG